ncbi:hypothetical protein D3C72_1803220 [compost metagenome]
MPGVEAERAQQQHGDAGFAQSPALATLLLPLQARQCCTGLPQLQQVLVLRRVAWIGLVPLGEGSFVALFVVRMQPPARCFAGNRILAHAAGTCCRATSARSRWPCAVCRLMPSWRPMSARLHCSTRASRNTSRERGGRAAMIASR